MRMLPSSGPGARQPPRQWAKSATLPRFGIRSRLPTFWESRPARPLASTRKRAHLVPLAVALGRDRDTSGVEGDGLHGGRLADVHTEFLSVLEQERVEVRPRDLVSVARPGLVPKEVERVLEPRLLVVERRAVLHLEPALGDGSVDAQAVQDRKRRRQQGLADMEAWERLALDEEHATPGLGEKGASGRAGRPAANDDHVVEVGRRHRGASGGTASVIRVWHSVSSAGSSRAWEQSRRTSGVTTSGSQRGTSACKASRASSAGAASVAPAAAAARRRSGWRHQSAGPAPAARRRFEPPITTARPAAAASRAQRATTRPARYAPIAAPSPSGRNRLRRRARGIACTGTSRTCQPRPAAAMSTSVSSTKPPCRSSISSNSVTG